MSQTNFEEGQNYELSTGEYGRYVGRYKVKELDRDVFMTLSLVSVLTGVVKVQYCDGLEVKNSRITTEENILMEASAERLKKMLEARV